MQRSRKQLERTCFFTILLMILVVLGFATISSAYVSQEYEKIQKTKETSLSFNIDSGKTFIFNFDANTTLTVTYVCRKASDLSVLDNFTYNGTSRSYNKTFSTDWTCNITLKAQSGYAGSFIEFTVKYTFKTNLGVTLSIIVLVGSGFLGVYLAYLLAVKGKLKGGGAGREQDGGEIESMEVTSHD
ncbi:MAG: hypothetical protein ACTSUE_21045 [Promethearchaeota archaeon]